MIQNINEVIDRLETIPELYNKVVYDHFTTAQQLPFAAYTYTFITSGADDYKGVQWISFNLELYTEVRDFELEHTILTLLSDVEIQSDCSFLDNEKMYMTTFNFTFPQKL